MGKKTPGPSLYQQRAEARKEEQLVELEKQEGQRKKAALRKRRGRATLISGAESGILEENL